MALTCRGDERHRFRVRITATQTLSATPDVGHSHRVYQGSMRPPVAPGGTTQVMLVVDVRSGAAELISRTEELVNDLGRTITWSVPGARVRKALVVVGGPSDPPAAPHPRDVLTIDHATRCVWVDGEPVRFAFREFELLCHLSARPGRAVSRGELMRDVWRDAPRVGAPDTSWRTVDTHVRRLRIKLGRYERILTTVRGFGYRFEARSDVRIVGGPDRVRPA
jgi:DNA-binding winged helix-turn-helix (wHTH) protein